MALLVLVLFVFLRLQVQAVDELSKEGILCIAQNEEKTALDRWLHCLQTYSSSNTQVNAEESSPEHLIEHKDLGQLTEAKDITVPDKIGFGEDEENKCALRLENENAKEDVETQTTSFYEEDTFLNWLKVNLIVLTVCRLLLSLFKWFSWKMADKEFSEPSMTGFSKDSLEGVPEISKSVILDHSPSTNQFATSNLQMLGTSLGSAVGAVISEVLLKSCSSGSPVPADKICMILESALMDLSLQVQEDDFCSRLVRDFITSCKSTYTTMFRIHQACRSYGGPDVTDSNFNEDNKSSIVKLNDEDCTSAKSCVCLQSKRSDFAWQVKEELSFEDASPKSEHASRKLRSVLGVDALPELPKCSRPLTGPREHDLAAPASSASMDYGFESSVKTGMHIPSDIGVDDPFAETLLCASAELTDKVVTHADYEVEDASSICEEPPSIMQSNAVGRPNNPLVAPGYGSSPAEYQKVFLKFYERHVRAQEDHNKFKHMKLQQLVKQQNLDEEKIQLASAANGLMRENIDLGRSKANFKENRVLEQQTKAAHANFCTTCADELAAGLCVMLTTLVYSVRMYSFALLNDLVTMCQPTVKESRRSMGIHIDWFYNSLDSLAGRLQAIVCQLTVTGRILIGSLLVVVVAQSLLRRSVTNSSQAMPATILIIVLGGLCGFIGKVSVDSLGGSGNRWWIVWGTFCLLHALVNCFTPSIYKLLHGSPTRSKFKFGPPFWLRRLIFHSTLVLFLPVLAGLLPFGNFSCVVNDLFVSLIERLGGIFASVYGWAAI